MKNSRSPTSDSLDCLNCGTPLKGQYCGHCGQRSRTRLISLWELMREAFGDLLELDSRLWRTLGPLLLKPGQLTREYLQGRRARYMPPFRTYLVLSVIFFVVVFFDPRQEFGLLFEPAPEPTAEEIAKLEEDKEAQAEIQKRELEAAKEKLQQLAERGVISPDVAEDFDNDGFKIDFDENGGADCEFDEEEWDELPDWLAKRLTPERIQKVCERIDYDDGKTFGDLLLDKIPVALVVMLPLMALVLKILYPLSRRYFVEHLLFFVHFHAFFFLILILQQLFYFIAGLLRFPGFVTTPILVASSLYVPVYLYRAVRRVYEQSHLFTIVKYVALFVAYVTGASLTLLGAVLVALLSV